MESTEFEKFAARFIARTIIAAVRNRSNDTRVTGQVVDREPGGEKWPSCGDLNQRLMKSGAREKNRDDRRVLSADYRVAPGRVITL